MTRLNDSLRSEITRSRRTTFYTLAGRYGQVRAWTHAGQASLLVGRKSPWDD